MRLPDGADFELVYQCTGDAAHEETVRVGTYREIDMFMYAAEGSCPDCKDEFELNRMMLDRIEVVVESNERPKREVTP